MKNPQTGRLGLSRGDSGQIHLQQRLRIQAKFTGESPEHAGTAVLTGILLVRFFVCLFVCLFAFLADFWLFAWLFVFGLFHCYQGVKP